MPLGVRIVFKYILYAIGVADYVNLWGNIIIYHIHIYYNINNNNNNKNHKGINIRNLLKNVKVIR